MKKLLFFVTAIAFANFANAQTVTPLNNVPFYSMYHYLGAGQTMPPEAFSEIPADAIRLHAYERDIISRKLTDADIAQFGNKVTMNVTIMAACDNYDRIGGVSLALVPKGLTTYTFDQAGLQRIELARFITPFMNKNLAPTSVPYSFQVDNLSKILHDPTLMAQYDPWIEFRADGYSAAANTQVAGCANRTDVFRGTLSFVSTGAYVAAPTTLIPMQYRQNLNNYNATDVAGTTTRIVTFTLTQPVDNAVLYLITSNHGANTAGEEYNRRDHYVYLDNQKVYEYKPGGISCEPFRQYNTQNNGIYTTTPKPLRWWTEWNNWCPGNAIPNREVKLGNLSAGTHTIKITVPDAVFPQAQGYIPISMYIQSNASGQIICASPTNFTLNSLTNQTANLSWTENGTSTNWQVLYADYDYYPDSYNNYKDVTATPATTLPGLTPGVQYEIYVKSKCTNPTSESPWIGPIVTNPVLKTQEVAAKSARIYPNPTKDFVNIEADAAVVKAEIFSIDGKKVMEQRGTNKIDIRQLATGTYLLTVYLFNGNKINQKLIKE